MKLFEELLNNTNIDFVNTENYTETEWLNLRTTGIGGSDAGAIMGMNKYATPLSVFIAKRNLLSEETKEKTASNESIQWGKMAESAIRDGLAKDLELRIEPVPGMFTSTEYPFMNANLDGLVFADQPKEINGKLISGLGGLEIKTATERNSEFTEDEVPDSYYCQVQHYMCVTHLDYFILAVLIGKVSGKIYVIPRNDDFIERLVQRESEFWYENVAKDVMPEPVGNERESEVLNSLFSHAAKEVTLGEEFEELCKEYNNLSDKMKELKQQQETIKERLKIAIFTETDTDETATDKVIAKAGDCKITWTKQLRKIVDTDALKKANLFEEYSKNSESMVMRISK